MCGAPAAAHKRPRTAPNPSAKPPRAQLQHFQGQKLQLGGDSLGAGPAYLLYLPSRS